MPHSLWWLSSSWPILNCAPENPTIPMLLLHICTLQLSILICFILFPFACQLVSGEWVELLLVVLLLIFFYLFFLLPFTFIFCVKMNKNLNVDSNKKHIHLQWLMLIVKLKVTQGHMEPQMEVSCSAACGHSARLDTLEQWKSKCTCGCVSSACVYSVHNSCADLVKVLWCTLDLTVMSYFSFSVSRW